MLTESKTDATSAHIIMQLLPKKHVQRLLLGHTWKNNPLKQFPQEGTDNNRQMD